MESITNTEDMLCNVLILALIVNDSLKSRVWENRKHGSVGVTIALKLNSILIWSKCYGFYLSKAINHAKEQYPNVQFAVADVTKLTDIFEDEFFSFVYMFNVVHAIRDKAAMLQKIKSVCKKGAILAVFDYNLKDPSKDKTLTDSAGLPLRPINLDEFKLLLEVIGWEIIEISDISDNYIDWYIKLLQKIDAETPMIKAIGYSKKDIKTVKNKFAHLLSLIYKGKLGGTILLARKV